MSYAGGARPDIAERTELASIYAFLRKALLASNTAMPYRGPASFAVSDMTYVNRVEGALDRFHGEEQISKNGATLFELRYSGGLLR